MIVQKSSKGKVKEIIVPSINTHSVKSDTLMRGATIMANGEGNCQKSAAMWMYAPRTPYVQAPATWTPASAEKNFQAYSNSSRHHLPQGVYLIPASDNGLNYGYAESTLGTCQSVCSTYRKYKRPNYGQQRKLPMPVPNVIVKKRCRSASNILEDMNQEAFQYKGLDRTIADNFLERQTSNSNMKKTKTANVKAQYI